MPQPRERLRRLKVKEVSLVDAGDNPGAHIVLFKRRGQPGAPKRGEPGYDPKRRTTKQPSTGDVSPDAPIGERDRRRRRRAVPPVQKLRVTTAEADDHTHPLELPDGPIAAGQFRTGEADDHTHDVDLPDIQPGQTADVTTSETNGHTHSVSVTANTRVAARRNGGFMRLLDKVYELLGRDATDAEVEKQLFDEIRAETMSEQVTEALMNRIGDFARSVRSIMFSFGDDEVADKEAAIATSLGQFVDNLNEETSDIFAGRITKAFDGVEADAGDEEIEELIADALGLVLVTQSADDAGNRREEGMDLSKLSKEDREQVEAALVAAGTVEGLAKSLEEKDTEIATLKAAGDDGDDGDDDVLKALPENVRKVVEAQLKERDDENAAMAKRLDKLEKQRQRDTFSKSVGNLEGLAESRDSIVDTLWAITDEETRKAVQKQLEASAEAVRRGGIFNEFGSDLDGGGDAYTQAETLAKALMEKDANLSREVAMQKVWTANPDLYDEYLGEQN